MSSVITKKSDYDILIYGDKVIHKTFSTKSSEPSFSRKKHHSSVKALPSNAKYAGDIILKKTNLFQKSMSYRSIKEEDEVYELTKKLKSLKTENATLKAKNKHLEENKNEIENLIKEPTRENLGPDGGKYRTWKLKNLLREKEEQIIDLENNLKLINIKELRTHAEVYYNECLRLRKVIEDSNNTPDEFKHQEKSVLLEKLSESQLNLIQMSKCYQEANQAAQVAREESDKNLEEINKLKIQIKKLEKEKKRSGKFDLPPNSLLLYGVEENLPSKFSKKVRLRGTVEEKVVTLQEREIMLLGKIKEMHEISKRMVLMKELEKPKSAIEEIPLETKFAEYVDDKDLEMELSKKINNFTRKRASVVIQRNWRKHRASTIRQMEILTFAKKCAGKKIYKFLNEVSKERKAKIFAKKKLSARVFSLFRNGVKIQQMEDRATRYRLWKVLSTWRQNCLDVSNQQERIFKFRKNLSAKIIQKNWREYKKAKDREKMAGLEIVSCMVGHCLRRNRMDQLVKHTNIGKKEFNI